MGPQSAWNAGTSSTITAPGTSTDAMASSARLSSSMCSSTFRQTQESGRQRAKSENAALAGSQTKATHLEHGCHGFARPAVVLDVLQYVQADAGIRAPARQVRKCRAVRFANESMQI